MLGFLTSLNLLNYLDRYLLAALLPIISVDLVLNHEQGGTLVSAFVIGYVLCSPLFGYLGDRFPRPPLMALGVLIWSIATALSGLADSFTEMFLLRVIVGIGEGSFATLAPTYIRDATPDPLKLNSRLSIFFVAIPVGSALGYALSGIIASQFSWHYAFFFGAAPGLILAPFLLRLKETRREVLQTPPLVESSRKIFGVPELRFAIGGYILQAFALNGVAAFITKLGVERGFTLEKISTVFGLILVGTGFIGTFLGGKFSTKLASRESTPIPTFFRFLGLSSLAGVPFLAAAFACSDPIWFLVFAGIGELMIFAGTAPINSIIVLKAPEGLLGLTQGLTITSLNLFGSLLGPVLVGIFADQSSLSTGLQLTSIALAFAGWTWFLGSRVGNSTLEMN